MSTSEARAFMRGMVRVIHGSNGRYGIPDPDHRLFGMLAPTVAGLYAFGVLQPRGGAGPLISRGFELLARLARIQSGVGHPIAIDLARVRRAEARHLVGVSETMREIAVANRVLDVYSWRMKRRRSRAAPRDTAVRPPAMRTRLGF